MPVAGLGFVMKWVERKIVDVGRGAGRSISFARSVLGANRIDPEVVLKDQQFRAGAPAPTAGKQPRLHPQTAVAPGQCGPRRPSKPNCCCYSFQAQAGRNLASGTWKQPGGTCSTKVHGAPFKLAIYSGERLRDMTQTRAPGLVRSPAVQGAGFGTRGGGRTFWNGALAAARPSQHLFNRSLFLGHSRLGGEEMRRFSPRLDCAGPTLT